MRQSSDVSNETNPEWKCHICNAKYNKSILVCIKCYRGGLKGIKLAIFSPNIANALESEWSCVKCLSSPLLSNTNLTLSKKYMSQNSKVRLQKNSKNSGLGGCNNCGHIPTRCGICLYVLPSNKKCNVVIFNTKGVC